MKEKNRWQKKEIYIWQKKNRWDKKGKLTPHRKKPSDRKKKIYVWQKKQVRQKLTPGRCHSRAALAPFVAGSPEKEKLDKNNKKQWQKC